MEKWVRAEEEGGERERKTKKISSRCHGVTMKTRREKASEAGERASKKQPSERASYSCL